MLLHCSSRVAGHLWALSSPITSVADSVCPLCRAPWACWFPAGTEVASGRALESGSFSKAELLPDHVLLPRPAGEAGLCARVRRTAVRFWLGSAWTGLPTSQQPAVLGAPGTWPFSCPSLPCSKGTCFPLFPLCDRNKNSRQTHYCVTLASLCVTVHSFISPIIHSLTHSTTCAYPQGPHTKSHLSAALPQHKYTGCTA